MAPFAEQEVACLRDLVGLAADLAKRQERLGSEGVDDIRRRTAATASARLPNQP